MENDNTQPLDKQFEEAVSKFHEESKDLFNQVDRVDRERQLNAAYEAALKEIT